MKVYKNLFFFIVIAFFFIVPFALATFPVNINEADIFFHLALGKKIIEEHEIEKQNSFTFTDKGYKSYSYEILFDTLIYLIYISFGLKGLIFLRGFFSGVFGFLLILFVMYFYYFVRKNYQNNDQIAYILKKKKLNSLEIITAVFIYILAMPGLSIRPHLFSIIFFLVGIVIFFKIYLYNISYITDNKTKQNLKKNFILLSIILIFWVNIHPGIVIFYFYIFFSFLFILSFLLFKSKILKKGKYIAKFSLEYLILFLFSLININHWNIYRFSIFSFLYKDISLSRKLIDEWAAIPILSFYFFLLSTGLFLVIFSLAISYKKNKYNMIPLFVPALIIGIMSYNNKRLLPFFGISSIIPISYSIEYLGKFFINDNTKKIKTSLQNVLNIIVLILLFSFAFIKIKNNLTNLPIVLKKNFPVKAVHFINKNYKGLNVFTKYEWGSYLMFMSPNKVFIDTRSESAYSFATMKDYYNIIYGNDPVIIKKYNIDIFLLPIGSHVIKYLDKNYKNVYNDNICRIYELAK